MKILVLVEDYPDAKRSAFPFVKQLVDEFTRQGHIIQVIAPYSITHNKSICKQKKTYRIGDCLVTVYRPLYITLSNLTICGYSLSSCMLQNAFHRGLKMVKEKPDFVYGHFWHSAYGGYKYAHQNRLPLFVASGESEIDFRADDKQKTDFCNYSSGVICVSTKNKDESISLGLTDESRSVIIPNAIDSRIFKHLNKIECRNRLNLPQEAFIIIFVGWFINRKGVLRVCEAVSGICMGDKVYSIFIGKGDENPICDNILYKGVVKHKDIPLFLNSADVFVLPTLKEGCCNAIVEAMACGLPIISSDLPFNKDVCDNSNSILVDPNNIEDIKDAIIKLRDNKELRNKLSEGSLKKASALSIDKRASAIIKFIKEKMSKLY